MANPITDILSKVTKSSSSSTSKHIRYEFDSSTKDMSDESNFSRNTTREPRDGFQGGYNN